MPLVTLTVSKQSILLQSDEHRFECLPSITLDSTDKTILAIGEHKAVSGGVLCWPLNQKDASDDNSFMLIGIMQYCLKSLLSMREGWRRYICLAPELEVHLSTEVRCLQLWFEQHSSDIGVRSVKFKCDDKLERVG